MGAGGEAAARAARVSGAEYQGLDIGFRLLSVLSAVLSSVCVGFSLAGAWSSQRLLKLPIAHRPCNKVRERLTYLLTKLTKG